MTAIAEAPVVTAGHRAIPVRAGLRAAVGALTTLLVVLTGVVLLAVTVGPRVFHYRMATMLTGSMSPTIDPGDVVVDVQEPATALHVGQIVSYHIPVDDHRVESHRVSWVNVAKDGAVLFRTKGDANNGVDPWTAKSAPHAKVWIVKRVLPVVGTVIRFLRQPLVSLALTRVVPAGLIIFLMYVIWRRPSRREADPTETA
jgi:signal peptidase